MCGHAVTAGMAAFFEHGDVLHLGCHLGLMDAAAAVARMLLDRPEQSLCVACIAEALVLTPAEAEVGVARVQGLPGFVARFGSCVGCSRRGRVVRALRARRIVRPAASDRAAGEAQ
jgi:hypothetical protein